MPVYRVKLARVLVTTEEVSYLISSETTEYALGSALTDIKHGVIGPNFDGRWTPIPGTSPIGYGVTGIELHETEAN